MFVSKGPESDVGQAAQRHINFLEESGTGQTMGLQLTRSHLFCKKDQLARNVSTSDRLTRTNGNFSCGRASRCKGRRFVCEIGAEVRQMRNQGPGGIESSFWRRAYSSEPRTGLVHRHTAVTCSTVPDWSFPDYVLGA